MSKQNLLRETMEKLTWTSHDPSEVRWVGSRDGHFAMSWDEFTQIADVEYDSGYGAAEVAQDLVVVGDGWWFERYEYDGSERWEYQTQPLRAEDADPFARIVVADEIGWETVASLNGHEEKE